MNNRAKKTDSSQRWRSDASQRGQDSPAEGFNERRLISTDIVQVDGAQSKLEILSQPCDMSTEIRRDADMLSDIFIIRKLSRGLELPRHAELGQHGAFKNSRAPLLISLLSGVFLTLRIG